LPTDKKTKMKMKNKSRRSRPGDHRVAKEGASGWPRIECHQPSGKRELTGGDRPLTLAVVERTRRRHISALRRRPITAALGADEANKGENGSVTAGRRRRRAAATSRSAAGASAIHRGRRRCRCTQPAELLGASWNGDSRPFVRHQSNKPNAHAGTHTHTHTHAHTQGNPKSCRRERILCRLL